uniref:Homeobox domain-containing protein n=1 Tax=Anopheles epiroticus TaxID=199890 RepID=A0A182PNI4_9DIPT
MQSGHCLELRLLEVWRSDSDLHRRKPPPSAIPWSGRLKLTLARDLNTEYLDLGFSRGLGSSSRAKRMRTSFKHHQLRTMKSYFAINHNPDAKDLKQLSQKTGLPKRVLQVWFQNARAKWRRMMMKQEGKIIDSDKGDGSLDLDGYVSHSPGSYIMGGPGSPSSLD